jgi:hypothetical protein
MKACGYLVVSLAVIMVAAHDGFAKPIQASTHGGLPGVWSKAATTNSEHTARGHSVANRVKPGVSVKAGDAGRGGGKVAGSVNGTGMETKQISSINGTGAGSQRRSSINGTGIGARR